MTTTNRMTAGRQDVEAPTIDDLASTRHSGEMPASVSFNSTIATTADPKRSAVAQ